jgi:long-chain acyl-CoA synthetase
MKVKILDQAKGSKKNILDFALQIGTVVGRNKLDGKHISIFMRLLYSVMNVLVYKKIRQKLGGRLRFFISGGAPLGKELAEFFYSLDILICEGYGLTETSPVISGNTPVFFKFGTVGKPLPNVEVKISEDREIVVRGDSVMQGYFQNEEATREVLKDGWFYTGDIGEFDSEGFLKITDRKKDIIKTSGGKMIAPQRIENLLKESPFISQIVVCGDKRRYITALIVPQYEAIIKEMATRGVVLSNAGEVIKNNEVANLLHAEIERLTESLAPIEKIKYFRLLPNEFTQAAGELTPTLKVKRRVIQEKYKNWIDQMYEEK